MADDLYAEFRAHCRELLAREAVPHRDEWERAGMVDRAMWRAAGQAGLLGRGVPPEHGGVGEPAFSHAAVFAEELVRADVTAPGFIAHNDVVASYLHPRSTPEQRERWLPGLCSGEIVAAIAISEPAGGSDVAAMTTTARRDGDHYVLDGSKAFVTNGVNADLVLVAARTSPDQGARGLSLIVVERGTPGFHRGDPLQKMGWHASDTCDLRFSDCRVPVANLVGREGLGSAHMMAGLPRERLSIAVVAVASAEQTLEQTLGHARERHAFGAPIGSLQHNRFVLASLDTEVRLARLLLDHSIEELDAGRLTVTDAARVKWWTTELQVRVADRAVQLHGGLGYLRDHPIARQWANSRVQTIYGGTTEVMKELIGRSLGL